MAFGLTATGFNPKLLADILAEIEADERAALDPTVDTSAESLLGQINGIMASHLAEVWEALHAAYNARVPGNAAYQTLDDLAAITGTTRAKPTKGSAFLTLTVAAATTIPAGAVAAVSGSSTNRWVTTAPAINLAGVPAPITVAAEAQTAGYFPASAGTITDIAVPVSGWTAVTNSADAVPGTDEDLDSALRLRRERELASGGTSPVDAIRAEVSKLSGVRAVTVLENPTDLTDTNGLPPHSIEVLVDYTGGIAQQIAETIWSAKAAGIQTFFRTTALGGGGTTRSVVDDSGIAHDVNFTVPLPLAALASVSVVYDDALYAGDAALKTALAAVSATLTMGSTLRISDLVVAGRAVAGVQDIAVEIGLSPSTLQARNLSCTPRQVLNLATGSITVVRVS